MNSTNTANFPVGEPMAEFVDEADLGWPMFERWLGLFGATVDGLLAGENVERITRCAEDMARVIHSKIHDLPNLRLDPARLTPEQKARYASYCE